MIQTAQLKVEQRDGGVVLVFAGRLESASIGALWRAAVRAAQHARGQPLSFDLSAVTFSDVGGATFLAAVEAAHGDEARLIGAPERVAALFRRARTASHPPRRAMSMAVTMRASV